MDDLRPYPTLADQQPAVDEVLHRPAHGRPGKAQLVGQVDLVLEPRPRRQLTGLYEVLQVLGHLEVERDGAVSVHLDGQGGTVHSYLSRGWHTGMLPIMTPGRQVACRSGCKYVGTYS